MNEGMDMNLYLDALALIARLSILRSFSKGRNTHDGTRLSEVCV